MAKLLTARQEEVLTYIERCIKRHGFAPTLREIAAEIDVSGNAGVLKHLRALERYGKIKLHEGSARAIQLLDRHESKLIPVYGKVAAGSPLEAAENVTREVPIPRGLFRKDPDFLLEVSGDSMIDLHILDGDLAAFKRTHTADPGEIVVAMVDIEEMSLDERQRCGVESSGLTLKRVGISGNRLLLKSANSDKRYSPFSLDPNAVRIEGKYLGSIRIA